MSEKLKHRIRIKLAAILVALFSILFGYIAYKLANIVISLVIAWTGIDILKAIGVAFICLLFGTYAACGLFVSAAIAFDKEFDIEDPNQE